MARNDETDLNRYDWSKATRGKYVEKARRSFETIVIDKKTAKALDGPEAKVFDGQLEALLGELADEVWKDAG